MVSGEMYCSSSFAGCTRRYHGLLVYQGRVLLQALHDEVNGIRLSSGWWGDAFLGEGLSYSTGATLYPVRQEFMLPDVQIVKTISFDDGLVIRYEVTGTASLMIRPLMTNRPVRELTRDPIISSSEIGESLILNDCAVSSTLSFTEDLQWYLNAYYPKEQETGYDAWEDHISPGFFSGTVHNQVVEIRLRPLSLPERRTPEECQEQEDIISHASRLCLHNGEIFAGYHWFTESWGRDTFISLPGLLLESGRFREAEEVFRWHLGNQKAGLLINRYPGSYQSADATLWFFWALFQYVQKLPGSPFVTTIRHELEELLHLYQESEVAFRSGSLITVTAGSTWMDTHYTPRSGIPVEVNALWILALELMEFLKLKVPVSSEDARREFLAFFNPETRCLYDVIQPFDPTIRSNQVIALAFGLVPFDEGRQAISVLKEKLLTPYGLRTCAPGSPEYYDQFEGDMSYHNGMVWPWQMGFYIDALIQYGFHADEIPPVIMPLWHHFLTDGAGMLPELFDGKAPYHPAGGICQAWSIAELIRARKNVLRLIHSPQKSTR
jgi:glycogen debranching enzyme